MSTTLTLTEALLTPAMNAIYIGSIVVGLVVYFILGKDSWKELMKSRHIYGIDINKTRPSQRATIKEHLAKGTPLPKDLAPYHIPESAGIFIGVVYLIVVCIIMGSSSLISSMKEEQRVSVLAASFGILLILLLGFMDDVLELRWRDKVLVSTFATIPLCAFYTGVTTVKISYPQYMPEFVKGILGKSLLFDDLWDMGFLYYGYMALICIFCCNSINILAGVNGVEVGQSLIIAIFMVIHNLYSMYAYGTADFESQLVSLVFLLPFITASTALLMFNWCPAKWFVGDSYTYLAGMVLASASIVGHFSKATLWLFLPQLLNFGISLPQLFGLVPCPKHRLPTYQPDKGTLTPTYNFTVLNLLLYLGGTTTEEGLCKRTLLFQILCNIGGLYIYHKVL
eukprot:TRINITY_DN84389_c0_g1_i1.p1 TRINITY_DN84389_c0_g1~~TRINITY_DN84389_c0_g1_i1.p1  ORF type:complete len:396 (+),score=42.44 TRINITY_DN84389_c0_g1_i1:140-1327(+)